MPAPGPTRRVSRWTQRREVIAHRLPQANEQSPADQRVADRDFIEVWQRAEHRQVPQIEIVAGVDAQTEVVRLLCCLRIAPEALRGRGGPAFEGPREWFRIELDAVRLEF